MLSAQLDGEELPAERAAADAHLDGCTACRRWLDQAAALTRRSRTRLVGELPDLTERILAAAPPPRPRQPVRVRLVSALRAALGVVGAVQLVLGLAQVGRGSAADHVHSPGDPTGVGHLWHESAAWNVAVGAGFLFIALRRTRPAGLLPMLSAFVATLLLLSVNDLITGRVDPGRLVSHGFLLLGYLMVVLLSRSGLRSDEPEGDRRGEQPRWRARFDRPTPPDAGVPGLRLLPPPTSTARVGQLTTARVGQTPAVRPSMPAARTQEATDRRRAA